jgi:hypothetical protein
MANEIFQNNIPYFLQQVLSSPAGSIPRGAQWVVAFDDLKGNILENGIKQAIQYEGKASAWKYDEAAQVILSDKFQANSGCVFAQAVDIPGEGLVVNPEGNIVSNAFRRSYVGQGINQLPEMRMTFLETNISFADNFLRPWVLATGTFGMIALDRNHPNNYRTNMTCYKIGPYSPGTPPSVLLRIDFYDICCTFVSNEEINYTATSAPQLREARFIYNYYSIDSTTSNQFVASDGSTPANLVNPPDKP